MEFKIQDSERCIEIHRKSKTYLYIRNQKEIELKLYWKLIERI